VRYLRHILVAVILVCAGVYAADYLSWRLRIPNRDPHGSVEVQRYYAVKLKDKKTSYMFDPPEQQECVTSLFPHAGDSPCWYLERHTRQEVDVDPGNNTDDFWKAP
jgi:hypothetical protein